MSEKFSSTNLYKKVGYTIGKYQLMEADDRVMIGVSGGKDSLFLLEALANRRKYLPFKINLMACHVHIHEVGYKVNIEYLENFCKNLDVPFILEELSVNLLENPKKAPCFVCSWHRRKKLFELTKKLGFNKLALGHHMDDALETLVMNMIYHGSMSSMPASLKMFDGRMYLIRPLIELANNDIAEYALQKGYPALESQCPYGDDTRRDSVKSLINTMAAMNKHARKNMFRAMSNIFAEYLPAQP